MRGILKKSIVVHPVIDRGVRQTQATLIQAEPPIDATYSSTVNFLLLAALMEAAKDGGFSADVADELRGFLRDRETLGNLNLHDRLAAVREALLRLEPHEPDASLD
jgi:hypothetical protein